MTFLLEKDQIFERLRLETFHFLFPSVTCSRQMCGVHCMGTAEGLFWWFLHLSLLSPICGFTFLNLCIQFLNISQMVKYLLKS